MKILYEWLNEYVQDDLPEASVLAEKLTMHAYEVEGIEERNGFRVLDIDVLPNRAADSLSHLGVAREIGTLLDTEFADAVLQPEGASDISSTDSINLEIESSHVRRATKRIVTGVDVDESSEEIKKRLKALGHQPINNIVDLTNYVMLATGQPVHAFDYDKLAGSTLKNIVVREAKEGEHITTLDGEEYELEAGMLVIADEEKALDIAGIKGGMNSRIDADTNRVMLSVCNFDPAKIRKTSQVLNLRTDASKRFENDISPEMVTPAMDYLSALVVQEADATAAEDIVEKYPNQANPYYTGVSAKQVNNLLGTDITHKEAADILTRAYCSVKMVDPQQAVIEAASEYLGAEYELGASVRHDAPDIFDCSSLLAYLFTRYGGVSIPRMTVDQYVYGAPVAKEQMQVGDVVFANTDEGDIHYESKEFMPGTVVEDGVDHCGLYLGDGKIIHATRTAGEVVVEPLEESVQFEQIVGVRRMAEGDRLRVKVPYWRRDIESSEDLIEEIGRVHGYENIDQTQPEPAHNTPPVNTTFFYTQKIRDILINEGFDEVYTYAFQPEGDIELMNPIADDKQYVRGGLRSGLADALEKNKHHKELLEGESIQIFEIGHVFEEDEEKLQLGVASTNEDASHKALYHVWEELGLDVNDFPYGSGKKIYEIEITRIMEDLPQPDSYDDLAEVDSDVTYTPFSRYPYVLRDIALWVPDEIDESKSKIQNIIQETAGELLENMKLFDKYDPEDQDRTSYAYRLVFQSDERTLEDEEVNELMDNIYERAKENGWEVR